MTANNSIHAFLAGSALTASLIFLYHKTHNRTPPAGEHSSTTRTTVHDQRHVNQTINDNSSNTADDASTELMDSSSLDQRMIRKAEGAIRNRTSRLIIVVERCTNDHNYSAILRTAEALGVQHIWIISPSFIQPTLVDDTYAAEPENTQYKDETNICLDKVTETTRLKSSTGQTVKRATETEKRERAMHHLFARKATEWLTVREFDDTKSCIDALKADGRQIWVTDLSQVAVCLTERGLLQHLQNTRLVYDGKLIPEKVAIVFGTEAVGCTTEMLNAADLRVYLPLRGFADSLNLSVATALVVHQMFVLDPTLVGAMSEEERRELRRDWYARLASQRLLSSSQKKNRAKLITYIRKCEEIGKKIDDGEHVDPDEVSKWKKMETKKLELDGIDKKVMLDAQTAVQDLIENPPDPITDMRRADEHRVCYVGKGTKSKYGELWEDMPATANAQAKQMASAAFFRERVDGTPKETNFSSLSC